MNYFAMHYFWPYFVNRCCGLPETLTMHDCAHHACVQYRQTNFP